MDKRTTVREAARALVWASGAASAWGILALTACGGGKPAASPSTCPEGTILKGDDCIAEPTSAASESKGPDEASSAKGSTMHDETPSASSTPATGGAYDKDAVDAQLKRAAKQVKNNCGSASDQEGAQNGPWGSTTATIVLARNGHVAEVTVPSPYGGRPVGDCVVNSFKKIQFPPYAGSSDASVTWDVELVKPKK